MHTIMPVDAHSRASRSTTWAAAARPWPLPPTLAALTRPSNPASPSALIVADGNVPRSGSAAWLAALAAMDSRADSYSNDMAAPGARVARPEQSGHPLRLDPVTPGRGGTQRRNIARDT